MHEKHLSFSQVLDIYGFRVVVKDIPACYVALGALHSLESLLFAGDLKAWLDGNTGAAWGGWFVIALPGVLSS